MHRLGFAVKVLGDATLEPLPSHDSRRWQSGPHLSVSLERVAAILERLDALDVRMYRMTSNLAPYASHPDLPQFHHQVEECAEQLAEVGARARELGIRLSFHPGQYVVLNSEREEVRAIAVHELDTMAAILDGMGSDDDAVVVLHVGGGAGGRDAAFARFEEGLSGVGERGRARLVIENDDRTFGLSDVLALHERTGLRIVWDALHHICHDPDGIELGEALRVALDTWPAGSTPKIHWSTGKAENLRAHADFVDPLALELFLRGPARGKTFDVMLEAKAKDQALIAVRDHLLTRGFAWRDGMLVAR